MHSYNFDVTSHCSAALQCFSLQNALVCLVFVLALLSGGIANAKYASDNQDDYNNSPCSYDSEYYHNDICEDAETLYSAEAATAVSSEITCIRYIRS